MYTRRLVALALLVMVWQKEVVDGSIDVVTSPGCTRKHPSGADCSSSYTGPCHITLENGEPMDVEDRGIAPNTRSCYRTCISPNPPFPDRCQVNRIAFENQSLPRLSGKNGEMQFILSSPNFGKKEYRKSTICRYHVSCGPDQVVGITVTHHLLENKTNCSAEEEPRCLDRLTLGLYGGQVTTCGSTLHLMDIQPEQLLVWFETNRNIEDCGFNIIATCLNLSSFFHQSCTVPGNQLMAWPEARRDAMMLKKEELFTVRAKRCHRIPTITVPLGSAVKYSNSTVQVLRGNTSLYRFPRIEVFQVYNRAEGYEIFYSNGPENRLFPGFGFIQVGRGAVHYIQEGIPPQFRPSADEEAVIRILQERIALHLPSSDFDVDDIEDYLDVDVSEDSNSTQTEEFVKITTEKIGGLQCKNTDQTRLQLPYIIPDLLNTDLDQTAIKYGNACNGFLKMTACAFQTRVLGRGKCSTAPLDLEIGPT